MYSYACFSSDGRLYCSVLYVKIVRLHFTSFAMLPSWHNNRIFQVSLTFNVLTWSMRAFFASHRCHHVKFSFWVQYNKASFSTNCNVYLNGCLPRYSALANSHMSAYSIMQHSPGYYTVNLQIAPVEQVYKITVTADGHFVKWLPLPSVAKPAMAQYPNMFTI